MSNMVRASLLLLLVWSLFLVQCTTEDETSGNPCVDVDDCSATEACVNGFCVSEGPGDVADVELDVDLDVAPDTTEPQGCEATGCPEGQTCL